MDLGMRGSDYVLTPIQIRIATEVRDALHPLAFLSTKIQATYVATLIALPFKLRILYGKLDAVSSESFHVLVQ